MKRKHMVRERKLIRVFISRRRSLSFPKTSDDLLQSLAFKQGWHEARFMGLGVPGRDTGDNHAGDLASEGSRIGVVARHHRDEVLEHGIFIAGD